MKNINRVVSIVSKALEVLHWVGAASMLVLLFCSIFSKEWMSGFLTDNVFAAESGDVSTYGFSLSLLNADSTVNMASLRIFAIGTFLTFILMAMIFRNVYLIVKTAHGKSWFSKGCTPFQKDIVRMVREIGIFSIGIPVLGLIFTIIAQLVSGVDHMKVSVNFNSIIMGILVLCLTQVFTYGEKLEEDTKGLI